MSDVCFSGAVLTLLGVLVAPILTVVTVLYRDSQKGRADYIADLIGQRDAAVNRLAEAAPVLEQARRTVQRRRTA